MDGSATAGSALLLMKQLREFNRHPVGGISAGLIEESNPFAWNVILVGPSDTLYEGKFHLIMKIIHICIYI
jgi:ubiquitin-conjugating enzyme E2 G1